MFTAPLVAGLGYIIFFFSYFLYFLGISQPTFQIAGQFTGADVFFTNLRYSLPDAIKKLEESGFIFPLLLVIFFTYVVPLVKLLLGVLCLIQPIFLKYINKNRYKRYNKACQEAYSFENAQKFITKPDTFFEYLAYIFTIKIEPVIIIRFVSKFQFTDSFMAMIMLAMLMETFISLELLGGGFYFWGYCMLSLLGTQLISLSQLPINKNMLFEGLNYKYELMNSNENEQNHDTPKDIAKNSTENSRINVKIHLYAFIFYFIISCALFVFIYLFFMFSKSLLVEVNVLDYRITLFTATLEGWELLNLLTSSDYIVNGFFTTIAFAFFIPPIHLLGTAYVYFYFAYSFLTDPDHKQSFEKGLTHKNSNDHHVITFDSENINFYNFIKSRASNKINEYDFLLLKYKNQKPWISTFMEILNHIGDWCMMDVYAIAMITSYYTLNAIPNLEANIPYMHDISHFFFMGTLVCVSVTTVLYFNIFNQHFDKLEQKTFNEYNKQFHYIPQLLDNRSPNNEESPNGSNFTKTIPLKMTERYPFTKFTWFVLTATVALFIYSTIFTAKEYTPYPELTLADGDDILGLQVPFFNQIIAVVLPFTIGNCNFKEIMTIKKDHYRPNWATEVTSNFLREFKFDAPSAFEYDPSSCWPIAIYDQYKDNNFGKYDSDCLTKQANENSTCGDIQPGLVRFGFSSFLGNFLIILERINGIGTSWIQSLDMFVNKDHQIEMKGIFQLPDWSIETHQYQSANLTCFSGDDICDNHTLQPGGSLIGFAFQFLNLDNTGEPATIEISVAFNCREIESDDGNEQNDKDDENEQNDEDDENEQNDEDDENEQNDGNGGSEGDEQNKEDPNNKTDEIDPNDGPFYNMTLKVLNISRPSRMNYHPIEELSPLFQVIGATMLNTTDTLQEFVDKLINSPIIETIRFVDIINLLIKTSSQAPYTCPAETKIPEEPESEDTEPEAQTTN